MVNNCAQHPTLQNRDQRVLIIRRLILPYLKKFINNKIYSNKNQQIQLSPKTYYQLILQMILEIQLTQMNFICELIFYFQKIHFASQRKCVLFLELEVSLLLYNVLLKLLVAGSTYSWQIQLLRLFKAHLDQSIIYILSLFEAIANQTRFYNKQIMYNFIFWSFIILAIPHTSLMQAKQKEPQAYTLEYKVINSKQFLVPKFNMFDCQKYMLPKLDTAPVHHTFFQPQELEEMYKELKINPDELNHNLDKGEKNQAIERKKSERIEDSKQSNSINYSSIDDVKNQQSSLSLEISKIPRPKLKESGFTHFIHIPLWDSLKQIYNNQIVPRIQEEDRDLLMPLSSMHMTVLVFRLRKMQDLALWSQVLKAAKKPKLSIKGVNIFPVKKNYARVLFLNVKGAEDLVDRVVSKAIELNLISQSQLSHIKFDKVSGTYKSQTHISLLRTKGEDLFDFTGYLKTLSKISISKPNTPQIRLSVIGSFNEKDYFNQEIVNFQRP